MKLFYRHFGSGPPVIILHGLLGSSDNWVTIARRLAEKFEVFVPDQRNHGQSPHSDDFTYTVMVEDLLEFMHDLHIEKAALIGHSMGGKVIMHFSLLYPYKVQKMVVVDISPRHYDVSRFHEDIIHAMKSTDFSTVRSRPDVENQIAATIKNQRIRQLLMKNLYRPGRGTFAWQINVEGIAVNLKHIGEGLMPDGIYPGPALFIRGSESDYITENDEDVILKYFPNAFVETIEGAGHWVHADQPDALCRLLSSFLGKECNYADGGIADR